MSYFEDLGDGWSLLVRNKSENYFSITLSKGSTIMGAAQIDKNSYANNISIDIEEGYRGRGYGKMLFEIAIEKYIKMFNADEIRFVIYYANHIFSNLLLKFGAEKVLYSGDFKEYVLLLKKYHDFKEKNKT